jgi:hypothetical protein
MKKLTWFGVSATAIWLAVMLRIGIMNHTHFQGMTPNAWGDYLSGIMAPIAFLWLIIGYFQQQHEIKQNTDALILQHKQLEHQTRETAQLVEKTDKQAIATEQMVLLTQRNMKEKQPLFKCGGVYISSQGNHELNFHNIGGIGFIVDTGNDKGAEINIDSINPIEYGGRLTLSMKEVKEFPFAFRIHYRDLEGNDRTSYFTLIGPQDIRQDLPPDYFDG